MDAILAKTLSIEREPSTNINERCDTPSFPHLEGMLVALDVLDDEKLNPKISLRHSELIAAWYEGLNL